MQGIGISRRWRLLGFVAILAAVLSIGAIACGDDDDEPGDGDTTPIATTSDETAEPTEGETAEPGVAGQMNLTSVEYSFGNVPASQPGGLTTITLDNIGGEEHQAQFVKMNEGVTFEQLQNTLATDETGAEALALVSVAGGVAPVAGGETGRVTHDLSEGTYAVLCFVPTADGTPHYAEGMITEFEVTAPEGAEPQPPGGQANLTVSDFTFGSGLTLPAGSASTVQVVNNGPQPHEVAIVALEEGFTVEQLTALFTEEEPTPAAGETPEEQGPPPFSAAGGLGAIPPSSDGYMQVNLPAGNYAFLCFVPDPGTGAPHAALGMVGSLTVE